MAKKKDFQPLTSAVDAPGAPSSSPTAWQTIKKSLRFIWPYGRPGLQLRIALCLVLLALGRAINLLLPLTYKHAVDDLTDGVYPLFMILSYGLLKATYSLLNDVRSLLWIAVSNYTTRLISLRTFEHLHNLSLGFHLTRKTGEILRIVDRGRTSISTLLNYFLFNIVPTLADIAIVLVYFLLKLGWEFSLLMAATITAYIAWTLIMTEWRKKFRREMISKDNSSNDKAIDSLLNFETVKYFGAEEHETNRYDRYLVDFMESTVTTKRSLVILNAGQNFLIAGGLLGGMLLAGREVVDGELTPGDFVMVNAYILQLYTPLNWLGSVYSAITNALVDMEKMWALLETAADVKDVPDAKPLLLSEGVVRFDHVNFRYGDDESRLALNDISFTVDAGSTLAIVGSSGAGKSTISRILFRFYDLESGSVSIDGQDIGQATQQSVRRAIGVVPQDTVLFNDTIRYNILYGRVDATHQEVEDAARAAQIHDRIMSFPEGYDTVVGERGLRLSGGEKQRVAIARTILKNPRVVILDEATSALDTRTEREILDSLDQVSRGRTTITIAHRLSTIAHADEIIVLDDGRIVERGKHADLVERQDGLYRAMWMEQEEAHNAAEIDDELEDVRLEVPA